MIIKQLPPSDLGRIAEIDRSEHVTTAYVVRDGELITEDVDWDVPRWPEDGPGDFNVRALTEQWAPILAEGGVLLGALDEDALAGFAIVRFDLTDSMAQFVALYVSRDYRRQGIARQLFEEADRLAKASGATEIYVSATPSASAVGFYRRLGFTLASEVNQALYDLEPEDIHMIKPL